MKEFIESIEEVENELGGVMVFWFHDMPWFHSAIISYGSQKTKIKRKVREQDHTLHYRINDTAQAMYEKSAIKYKYALVETFS